MMIVVDLILQTIEESGPMLPIEIANKLKLNSFVAAAYMSQLAESGKLRASTEKVGGTFLYFFPAQENAAKERIQSLLSAKKTARTFAKDVPDTPEVRIKRAAFEQRLKAIEDGEQKIKETKEKDKQVFLEQMQQAVNSQLSKPRIEPTSVVNIVKQEKINEMPKIHKPIVVKKQSKIISKAVEYMKTSNIDILSQEVKRNGKEAEFIAVANSDIGPIKLLVKVKSKKTISEADLSSVYTDGMDRKLPVLLITDGKLSKTAQVYLNKISGLVKVRNVK